MLVNPQLFFFMHAVIGGWAFAATSFVAVRRLSGDFPKMRGPKQCNPYDGIPLRVPQFSETPISQNRQGESLQALQGCSNESTKSLSPKLPPKLNTNLGTTIGCARSVEGRS